MMNQNLIKGLAVAAIWCSSTLVLQAAQDNIAPRAHVTVSNVLNENYAAGNLVDGKIMYGDKGECLQGERYIVGSHVYSVGTVGMG